VAQSDILPSRSPKLERLQLRKLNGSRWSLSVAAIAQIDPAANAGPRTCGIGVALDKLRQFGPLPSREF